MADESDVENALVALVTATLYPQGTSAGSITGIESRIYRGWPNSAALDNDLKAGLMNVTIFPVAGTGQVTPRYLRKWETTPQRPTLSAAVQGATVSFTGTADPGQLAGLRIDGQTYAYPTGANDTPASVAANLAAQARVSFIVLLSSATLTVPSATLLDARVVASAQAINQVRRQQHGFRVTCWAPSPAARDATATAVDQALAQTRFLGLPDGTQARLVYAGTAIFDQSQDALLYRRDLVYSAEYPTLASELQPAMLWGDLNVAGASIPA
ncbi:MAG TPA: hypothetical protein VFA03_06475 [Acetobacteraceae bacterium]|nr:hypothetical protein [Acetobacteraceae bacterium]